MFYYCIAILFVCCKKKYDTEVSSNLHALKKLLLYHKVEQKTHIKNHCLSLRKGWFFICERQPESNNFLFTKNALFEVSLILVVGFP